jgi:hypothetical protein
VVNAALNLTSLSFLYVTDYTTVPGRPTSVTASGGLDTCILKIALSYDQIEMARVVEGGYYTICKLRLQIIPGGDGIRGRLGGDERLIHKLNPNESNNQHLKALIQ